MVIWGKSRTFASALEISNSAYHNRQQTDKKMKKNISSIAELVSVLSTAKAGGQFATIYGETAVRLNKFPTDGSERIRIKDDFNTTKRFRVTLHFAEDYDKKMSKLLGEDYKASDTNRIHLLHNVLMQYVSTSNVCLIYMPADYAFEGTFVNGVPASAEDLEYIARYTPKAGKSAMIEYRTIGVKNVTKMVVAGVTYNININLTETLAA